MQMQKVKNRIMIRLKNLRTWALLFAFSLSIGLKAQVYSAFGHSVYAGVYSTVLNPAFSASDRHKWHINLIGAGINANNNYMRLSMPYSPYRGMVNKVPPAYQTPSGNAKFEKSWMVLRDGTKPKHASAQAHILGPSVLLKIGSFGLGLSTEAYANARAYCIDKKLANAIFYEFDSMQGAFDQIIKEASTGTISTKGGTVAASGYAAIGFNISKAFTMKWDRQIAFGITPKMVWGFGFTGLKMNDFNITGINSDNITISNFSAQSEYSQQTKRGFGADIGISYLHNKPGPSRSGADRALGSPFNARIGLALLNVGGINYDANQYSVSTSGEVTMAKSDFENLSTSNGDSVAASLWRNYGQVSRRNVQRRVGLPTALHLSITKPIKPNIYISGSWVQSMRKRNSYHMRQQSYIQVTPHYVKKHWEVGVPLGLMYDYRAPRMGLYARFGPLFIGTHSLNGLLNTRNAGDADLFFGLSIRRLSRAKSKIEREREGMEKGSKPDKCGEF
jgi:hypothetical protein